MTAAHRAASSKLFFLQQFLRNPRMVGSVVPTSDAAIDALLDPIDWEQARCVVEYGPGTGVFTREILRRLGPKARLVAIDTNPLFTDYLRHTIIDDRLVCVAGSAADVEAILAGRGLGQADYVVSGLPFSTLPLSVADAIMDATEQAIRPGGAFLIYQYSRFVLSFLRRRFGRVESAMIWLCIPPARLFWASKESDALSAAGVESLAAE
jgi:phospholipid N-methyltransferase